MTKKKKFDICANGGSEGNRRKSSDKKFKLTYTGSTRVELLEEGEAWCRNGNMCHKRVDLLESFMKYFDQMIMRQQLPYCAMNDDEHRCGHWCSNYRGCLGDSGRRSKRCWCYRYHSGWTNATCGWCSNYRGCLGDSGRRSKRCWCYRYHSGWTNATCGWCSNYRGCLGDSGRRSKRCWCYRYHSGWTNATCGWCSNYRGCLAALHWPSQLGRNWGCRGYRLLYQFINLRR
jgi:hypothetical protein